MQTGRVCTIAVILGWVLFRGMAAADVVESGQNGFVVRSEVTVAAPAAKIYAAMTKGIGSWWDAAHTYSLDSHNLSLDATAGGCFCERLPGGGSAQHLTVVMAWPGKELRLTGALGPLQQTGLTGSLIWKLSEEKGQTKVELSYAVGGYRPGGAAELAAPVDAVLNEQLVRLKNFIEQGHPVPE